MLVPPQKLEKVPGIITPFCKKYKYQTLSGGLAECGYDIAIDQDLIIYPVTLWNLTLKAFGCKRPSFLLASSVERFCVPVNAAFMVLDKSSWARRGLAVQNTCGEPGWEGYLTLELSNHGEETIEIERGTPIAQVIFFQMEEATKYPYNGKYQGQEEGPQGVR